MKLVWMLLASKSQCFFNYRNFSRTCMFFNMKNDTLPKSLKQVPGADPGFLERGFICIKEWGLALLILSHLF